MPQAVAHGEEAGDLLPGRRRHRRHLHGCRARRQRRHARDAEGVLHARELWPSASSQGISELIARDGPAVRRDFARGRARVDGRDERHHRAERGEDRARSRLRVSATCWRCVACAFRCYTTCNTASRRRSCRAVCASRSRSAWARAARCGPSWTRRSVVAAAQELKEAGVASVAIALLHAYANPAHERRVEEIVRAHLPEGIYVTCSADILPEIREYERTSTAVVNAYIGPVVSRLSRRPGQRPPRHRRRPRRSGSCSRTAA